MDQNSASDDRNLNLPFLEQNRNNDGNNNDGDGNSHRLPFAQRLNDTARNHFVACAGEFLGTFFFLFLGLSGAQVALLNVNEHSDPVLRVLYVSMAFGFSLAVNVWVMYRVSGGLFNPAVTVAMCLVSAVPWDRGMLLIISQLLSSIVSSAVVTSICPGPLALTKLNPTVTSGQGFLIELFLTFQLVLSITMMAGEKNAATHMAPVGIGLALFAAEISGVYFTGGSLNPARSFGPAVVAGDFSGHHWIYWAGPFGGAVLAAGTYKFMKILEYEKANPGQDHGSSKTGSLRI